MKSDDQGPALCQQGQDSRINSTAQSLIAALSNLFLGSSAAHGSRTAVSLEGVHETLDKLESGPSTQRSHEPQYDKGLKAWG